jgi:hypothetical protein
VPERHLLRSIDRSVELEGLKAMDRREEALREVERWEEWIKSYAELSELTLESLPKGRAKVEIPAPDSIILASTLRDPNLRR